MMESLLAAAGGVSDWELVARLALAGALGGAIGLEREFHGRQAGLRTQMLVAIGSALAMVVSLHFTEVFGGLSVGGATRVDPTRAAYGVLTGIGFLGAGAIMHYGADIRGLTTAASLWCTATIGLASGFGMYFLSVATAVLVLFILVVLEYVERRLVQRREKHLTLVVAGPPAEAVERFRTLLRAHGVAVRDSRLRHDVAQGLTTVTFELLLKRPGQIAELFALCGQAEGVREVRVE